jgi:hypothetical protein
VQATLFLSFSMSASAGSVSDFLPTSSGSSLNHVVATAEGGACIGVSVGGHVSFIELSFLEQKNGVKQKATWTSRTSVTINDEKCLLKSWVPTVSC